MYLSIVLGEGLRGYRWWRAVWTPCLLGGLHFVHSRVDVASNFFFLREGGKERGREVGMEGEREGGYGEGEGEREGGESKQVKGKQ